MVNRMCVYMLLFSCQVVSDSSQPDGMQQARFLCPPLSPRVCSNSCPLSQWWFLTILSSACPFTLCFNLSQHQGLFSESTLCIKWPKYWNFSFSISPSSEYLGLISFRMDWLDLLAVQRAHVNIDHHSARGPSTFVSCWILYKYFKIMFG